MTDLASARLNPESSDRERDRPLTRHRLAFALFVGAASAAYVFLYARHNPGFRSDFDQVWAAARALLHRENPYEVIGYNKPFFQPWPIYYPLPAAVLLAPLGALPLLVARCLFVGGSAAILAWAITRDGWSRIPAFLSISFMVSIELAQWSILLAAAVLLPGLSWVGIAKPNWGVAIVASASSPRIWKPLIVGAAVLLVISFAMQPHWVADWQRTVQSANFFRAPLTLPFGFVMLAALLRWRRPEARLLLAIACVPQTPGLYDALVLFTIPRSTRETLALVVASFAVFFALGLRWPWPTGDVWMADVARFTLWFMYLPAVAMVLRRPNEGGLPIPGGWMGGARRDGA